MASAPQARKSIKFDRNKPALDLIDPFFEMEMGYVLMSGVNQYGFDNWKGLSLNRVLAAVKRHINAIQRGEFYDKETRLQHAAHAASGLMFAHFLIKNKKTKNPDTRWNND